MAESRRRTGSAGRSGSAGYYREAYIHGNAVRSAQPAPRYAPDPGRRPDPYRQPQRPQTREEIRRIKQRRSAARRNQQRELEMSRGYVTFLVAATLVCFCVCLLFVHVQADNTARMKEITALENEISLIREDNLAVEKRIETTMNLEEVKKTAQTMGFTYPTAKQIHHYTVADSDYMNQYGEIPSN